MSLLERSFPVAGIATVYRKNSHADVILGKILEGYDQQGGRGPDLKLASLYLDQTPANDLGRELARKHGVHLATTIEEALTLGGDKLAVRGVLNIGEHGDYPETPDTKQRMYPRRRFFDEVAAAFRKHQQVVPLFSDKHLAYNWADAKHMYDTARAMQIPFMAGSSVPVGWRVPALSLPQDCRIEERRGGGLRRRRVVRLSCPGRIAVHDRAPQRGRNGRGQRSGGVGGRHLGGGAAGPLVAHAARSGAGPPAQAQERQAGAAPPTGRRPSF